MAHACSRLFCFWQLIPLSSSSPTGPLANVTFALGVPSNSLREYWHWVVSGPEETMAVNTWIGSEAQREHRNFSEPALLKKLGAGWKAMQKWTPEWVERHGESFNIEHSVFACVRDGNSIHPEDVADHEALPAHVSVFETLPAFFEAYRDTSGRYTACFASVKVFPEADMLRNKDAHLPLPASDQEANVHLWLSRGLLETGLHYDDFSNSNLLLRGRKRFLVMPPHDSPHLYQNAELDPAWDLGSPQGRAARQAFLKDLERAEADFEGQFQDDQADMFMEPPGVLGRNDNMNMANGEFPPDDEDPEDADQGEHESPRPLQRRKRVRLDY